MGFLFFLSKREGRGGHKFCCFFNSEGGVPSFIRCERVAIFLFLCFTHVYESMCLGEYEGECFFFFFEEKVFYCFFYMGERVILCGFFFF